MLHIVNTRFMQEQGHLQSLAASCLALFEIFCLPTMKQQTTQNFLWIIKTDPNLHPTILRQMVEDLQDYPNFYLVASNNNFRINEHYPGAWRGGAEGRDLAAATIYTGNRTLLERALAMSEQRMVLETRLDADDGLHLEFLETVQQEALERLRQPRADDGVRWMYWCARRHLEWHWQERTCKDDEGQLDSIVGAELGTATNADALCRLNRDFGVLSGASHEHLCVTPGITVGFAVGTSEQQVPIFPHHLMAHMIRELPPEQNCGAASSADCLVFVENFIFEAIRSRTPTSAGMANVTLTPQQEIQSAWVTYIYWNMLKKSFGIEREQLRWMHEYLSEHVIDIARDNLLGQCTDL